VFQAIQRSKRENYSCGWKCQWTHASRRVFPVRRSEEKQRHRHQRDNGELKDMCRRAFVGLGRLSLAAKHGKQSQERQDDYNSEANVVDLLLTHGGTSFPLSLLDWLPIMAGYTETS